MGDLIVHSVARLTKSTGDYVFNASRRFFLSTLARSKAHKSPIWGYIFRQSNPGLPAYVGTPHGAECVTVLCLCSFRR